jgi:hypothetical protein
MADNDLKMKQRNKQQGTEHGGRVLLLRIREILGSNLGLEIGYPD